MGHQVQKWWLCGLYLLQLTSIFCSVPAKKKKKQCQQRCIAVKDARVAEIMDPSALASMGNVATRLALPSHGEMVAVRKLRKVTTGISNQKSNFVRGVIMQKCGWNGNHTHCRQGHQEDHLSHQVHRVHHQQCMDKW